MKRAIIVFSLFAIFSGLFAVENLFSFSIGPQSGLVFYGDEDIKEDVKTLHGSHALVGAQAEVNVNPFKQITFFAGAHILCDFVKENKNYSNHIHYDFPFGVKIYPGLGGLCGGMAYTFGMTMFKCQNQALIQVILPGETASSFYWNIILPTILNPTYFQP